MVMLLLDERVLILLLLLLLLLLVLSPILLISLLDQLLNKMHEPLLTFLRDVLHLDIRLESVHNVLVAGI